MFVSKSMLICSTSPGSMIARRALRDGLLAVGAVHLRYKHAPNDYAGAAKIFAEFRNRILSGLDGFMEEEHVRSAPTTVGTGAEMMLCGLILLVTAGVSKVSSFPRIQR